MKKIPLVFLCGFKRSGKDQTYSYLKELSHGKMQRVAFADVLKDEYYSSIGVKYDPETEDAEFKEAHRNGIIAYGEGKKHEKGMDHWIESALDKYLLDEKNEVGIVVTDCRRTEEVLWFEDFKLNALEKYKHIRERYIPLFIGVHKPGTENDDKDYLTSVAVNVAGKLYTFTGFIQNDKGLKELKQSVTDFYVNKIK